MFAVKIFKKIWNSTFLFFCTACVATVLLWAYLPESIRNTAAALPVLLLAAYYIRHDLQAFSDIDREEFERRKAHLFSRSMGIASNVISSIETKSLPHVIISQCENLLNETGKVAFFSIDRETGPNPIRSEIHRGFKDDTIELFSFPLDKSTSVIGRAVIMNEIQVIDDSASRYWCNKAFIESCDLQQFVVIPFVFGNTRLGALLIENKENLPKEHLSQSLSPLKDQIPIALENRLLYKHVEDISARMLQELELAQSVQLNLIPEKEPEIKGYDVKGLYLAATEVGGDYYDFIPLDDHKIGIVIADVSGHGVPAALLMTMFRMILRNESKSSVSPLETIKAVSSAIYGDIRRGYFITACYCVLDLEKNTLTMVNAGHTPAIQLEEGVDGYRLINPDGMAVGFDSGTLFDSVLKESTQELKPGDIILLYTDGVTEAFNIHSEQYRVERLGGSLMKCAADSASSIMTALNTDLKRFTGKAKQNDDIAIVVLKRKH